MAAKRFTDEFKKQVVDETLAGSLTLHQVAQKHGIAKVSVERWRREAQKLPASPSRRKDLISVSDLERRLEEAQSRALVLEQERDEARDEADILQKLLLAVGRTL